MGNEVSGVVRGIGFVTGLPLGPVAEAVGNLQLPHANTRDLSVGAGVVQPWGPLHGFDEPLKELVKLLQELLASSSHLAGHFILVLLFTDWDEYITKVKKALEEEAQHVPEHVFIPGGSIIRSDWERFRLKTIYVFSKYGNYIGQPHSAVHQGLIMVYFDQSGKSKQLVLHRFDLSADYPEEKTQNENGKIKAGRVPAHQYAEEFYFRTMMKTGQRDGIHSELISILERTQPNEIVERMLNFHDSYPHINPVDMANTFLQSDIYNVNIFQSTSGSGSGCSRDNNLTEMLHIRDKLPFYVNCLTTVYEGTLHNVSLLDIWKVVQESMRKFPKKYSVVSANCIQFCDKIRDGLRNDLDMKKNIDDPWVKEILLDGAVELMGDAVEYTLDHLLT